MTTEPDFEAAWPDWLRLALTPGLSNRRILSLLREFSLPEQVFGASPERLRTLLGASLAGALLADDPEREQRIAENLEWARRPGHRLIALGEPDYPAALLDLADPPALLWARGRIELLRRPAIAIVGSRQATRGGLRHADGFARVLGDAGLVIVSGLALGIDAAAHRGGIESKASSIAIVGHGLDQVYPRSHFALADALATRGLVLSEFAIGMPPLADHFPRRNRIIAALGQGVLVIEAARGSGSLITCRLALDIGREVFAVPGSIDSTLSKGCHLLIKQGAKLVEDADDVLIELRLDQDAASATARSLRDARDTRDRAPSNDHDGKRLFRAGADHGPEAQRLVDAVARSMLDRLGWDPVDIDELSRSMDLDITEVQSRVVLLELAGRVERFNDGRVKRLA